MWSDALLQLDENSLKYRVEEMQEELDQAHKDILKEKTEKEAERTAKEAALIEKEAALNAENVERTAKEAALARIAELEALLEKQS